MYHAESDSRFVIDASEMEELINSSIDGALCFDVTGDPAHEQEFQLQEIFR